MSSPALVTALWLIVIGLPAQAADQAEPPKANPQMQMVLNELQNEGVKPIETFSPPDARRQPTPADAVKAVMKEEGKKEDKNAGLAKVDDRSIQGADAQLPARVYVPEGQGPMPLIVYFHGGGFVIANKEVYDAGPRALAIKPKRSSSPWITVRLLNTSSRPLMMTPLRLTSGS